MILLTAQTRIWLASKPADFRCGIDGFVALCRQKLNQEPRNGHWFVFTNRTHTMIRVLCYDGNGFWLMTKRLSQGRFDWPKNGKALTPLMARMLTSLVAGESDWFKVA